MSELEIGQRVVLKRRPKTGLGELLKNEGRLWLVRLDTGEKLWTDEIGLIREPAAVGQH